jgi:hypothetical protein
MEEPLTQRHVSKLVAKLSTQNEYPERKIVNIVDWYMFTTFDIVGELCFGDAIAFDCLHRSEYHPWILEIFSYFKFGALFRTIHFYPFLEHLIMRLLPTIAMDAQEKNYQWPAIGSTKEFNLKCRAKTS